MKPVKSLTIAGLLAGVLSCSSSPAKVILHQTVGPNPSGHAESSKEGVLQVFSARQMRVRDVNLETFFEGSSALDLFEPAHTDYTIYGPDGKVVEKVRNAQGLNDANPVRVTLPSGTYQVEARAQDYATTTFNAVIPVVVEPGRITRVHLDSDWHPSNESSRQSAVVRLSDGRPIGWSGDAWLSQASH